MSNLAKRCQQIEMILSDVDGVLTDGGVIYDNHETEIQRFQIRDGLGIKLWQRAGKSFGLVTGRKSTMVSRRARELGITLVQQDIADKWPVVQQMVAEARLELHQVCYIGDDLPDLRAVQAVGLGVAVADAAEDLRSRAHYTTQLPGGRGAVREVIEMILRQQQRWEEILAHFVSPTKD